ncbi:MAG: cupin domain-containing protein [Thermovirgaceae bacterium]
MKSRGNLYEMPEYLGPGEFIEVLFESSGIRIERIISMGDATPPGEWYDQDEDEWVLLLAGEALLEYDNGETVRLVSGDWILIGAHDRHRVAWTSSDPPCVWLAVFGNLQED